MDGFLPSTFGDFGRDRFLAILVAARVLSGALWDFSGVFGIFQNFQNFREKTAFFSDFSKIFRFPVCSPVPVRPSGRAARALSGALSGALRALFRA